MDLMGLTVEIATGSDEKIFMILKSDESMPMVDFVHLAENKETGEWRPTGKGFSVSVLFLSDFINTLKWADKAL